ncbi:ARID DNA-binding domain-containing protein [Tanacetum coccineum]|uniref:ARID DNA-binding domain-containing protein n=1 Tax=Tanacetum coccineum TaxID=301880 RepID=A0ABQ5GGQ5_9ASTR
MLPTKSFHSLYKALCILFSFYVALQEQSHRSLSLAFPFRYHATYQASICFSSSFVSRSKQSPQSPSTLFFFPLLSSLQSLLYAMMVNTFPRIVSFLDLIKIDRLVYRNWEVLRKKFIDMLEWFYLVYLKQDVLGDLPPVIEVVKVDLLGLYKLVDNLGGYIGVKMESNMDDTADEDEQGSTSSSDDFIVIT